LQLAAARARQHRWVGSNVPTQFTGFEKIVDGVGFVLSVEPGRLHAIIGEP